MYTIVYHKHPDTQKQKGNDIMWQEALQLSSGVADERFFILNENGFQNGFSLGTPVRAGGINAQFGWTYSNNEIFTETKDEGTNNSITLNGTIANNNYKYFILDFSCTAGRYIKYSIFNYSESKRHLSIFFTHGIYLGLTNTVDETPTSLDLDTNTTYFIIDDSQNILSGNETITIHRIWLGT